MADGQTNIETINQSLDWHRRGAADRMQTVQLLSTVFKIANDLEKREICECLERILRTESLEGRTVNGIGVNVPMVALLALARFGPTSRLPDAVFSRLERDNVPQMETWARELYPTLKDCLFQHQDRFPSSVLTHFIAFAATYKQLVPPCTVFLDAMADFDASLDRLEFEKFEKLMTRSSEATAGSEVPSEPALTTLGIGAGIQDALKEARDHLHGDGQFDPKKAAGLLRSSMEESHRAIVHELAKTTGKPYEGGEKDGARRYYIRDVGFISIPEEKFLSAVYSLISKEASHKLVAPRETVLVLYATVDDFIQLLFRRLRDRKSIAV